MPPQNGLTPPPAAPATPSATSPDDSRENVNIQLGGRTFQINAPKGLSDDEIVTRATAADPEFAYAHSMTQAGKAASAPLAKATIPGERVPGEQPSPWTRLSEITTGVPHPLDSATGNLLPEVANRPGQVATDAAKSIYEGPRDLTYGLATHPIDTITSLTGGPQFAEDVRAGRYGAAAADVGAGAINSYMLAKGAQGLPELAETTARGLTSAKSALSGPKAAVFGGLVRDMSKTGDYNVAEAAQQVGEGNVARDIQYAEKVSDINRKNSTALTAARQASEDKVAAIERDNRVAQNAYQDHLQEIRDANNKARQAVAQGVDAEKVAKATAPMVAQGLDELERSERAKARAAYPKVNGTVDPAEVNSNLQAIVDDKLRGAGPVPSSLARALADTRTPTPLEQASVFRGQGSTGRAIRGFSAGEALQSMSPEARTRYLSTLDPSERAMVDPTSAPAPGGEPITFDDLHGMYSEFGRELFNRDLPGDSRAALGAAREWAGQKMMEMAKAEGKAEQFRAAQKGWQILENTFRNTDPVYKTGSPIAKALQARDPISGELRTDYVRQILTDDKAHTIAQDLLKRYPSAGPVADLMRVMKDSSDQAKAAPKKFTPKREPSAPEPKPLPTRSVTGIEGHPEPPSAKTFNAQDWADKQIRKYAAGGFHTAQGWRLYRLPYTIVDRIMQSMAQDPEFRAKVAGRIKQPTGVPNLPPPPPSPPAAP